MTEPKARRQIINVPAREGLTVIMFPDKEVGPFRIVVKLTPSSLPPLPGDKVKTWEISSSLEKCQPDATGAPSWRPVHNVPADLVDGLAVHFTAAKG